MAPLKCILFAVLFAASWLGTAHAAVPGSDAFTQWLQDLEQDAVVEGIAPDTAHAALDNAMLDERVLALDEKQPETTTTFADYIQHVLTPARIAEGRTLLHEHAGLLNVISSRYGVQPEIIVALWGVESNFGRNSGDFSIIDSLVTLAYEGRRASFFRGELINALRILDQQHVPSSQLRGSWAGAMGQCQFMPSTYLRYAVSYSSGNPDIWDNTADVFASIANYIAADGWRGDQSWGYEVTLTRAVPEEATGLKQKHVLAELNDMGVRKLNGEDLPNQLLEASLVAPDGPDGRHFLVYDNLRALMRWNHSTFFAVSVGLLADRIE